MSTVEQIQQTQASHLLQIIQTEMQFEATRAEKLAKVTDPEEYKLLSELFHQQREGSKARIELLRVEQGKVLQGKVEGIVKYVKEGKREEVGTE